MKMKSWVIDFFSFSPWLQPGAQIGYEEINRFNGLLLGSSVESRETVETVRG